MPFVITRLAAGISIGGLCVAVLLTGCGSVVNSNGTGGTPTPTPTPSATNEWKWVSGSNTANALAAYGTQGTPSASNVPGARYGAVSWTDSEGDLWLFGGGTPVAGGLNDLWEFNPTTMEWTWVSGANSVNPSGVYGSIGIASASNSPGGRNNAVSWIDLSGDLWLFGGNGYDATGTSGDLNDLWEFSPTSKEWTWIGGSNSAGSSGNYGTEGTPSAADTPGARLGAVSWTDSNGNFWLFGGQGYASNGTSGDLNDLWEFSPPSRTWTWVGGGDVASQSVAGAGSGQGNYGTLGVASATNIPGARGGAASWIDSGNNLWLFGGFGHDSADTYGNLNDLWEYSTSSREWTWVSGSNTVAASAVYGVLGTPSISNVPGARNSSVSWIDSSGNLWLFGGNGQHTSNQAWPNDLWEFNPSTKTWTWVGGGNSVNASEGEPGTYGTLGLAASSNVPGGRSGAVSWKTKDGAFWLFGGYGYDSAGTHNDLNDLWRYEP